MTKNKEKKNSFEISDGLKFVGNMKSGKKTFKKIKVSSLLYLTDFELFERGGAWGGWR